MINIIVLLNMLIAMMSNSYAAIAVSFSTFHFKKLHELFSSFLSE